MRARVLHRTAALLMTALALSCATPNAAERPAEPNPTTATNTEPVPPPSSKKGVILPTDVKLGPNSAGTGNSGTAGAAVGPTVGTSSSPN